MSGPPPRAVAIRHLHSDEDYEACVRLQVETWGPGYTDTVPASLLRVTQHIDGLVAGAFDAGGAMVGFIHGLTGFLEGELIHWSHMLAVTPAWRRQGIGRRLKEYQRESLRDSPVRAICWTFDPLVAAHARRNLLRLGAEVRGYLLDAYPNTGSTLHAFGTDRLVARWPIHEPAESVPAAAADAHADAPVLNDAGDRRLSLEGTASIVRIEIPSDIASLASRSLADARIWRAGTRQAFTRAFEAGYRVRGYAEHDGRCFYILAHEAAEAEAC